MQGIAGCCRKAKISINLFIRSKGGFVHIKIALSLLKGRFIINVSMVFRLPKITIFSQFGRFNTLYKKDSALFSLLCFIFHNIVIFAIFNFFQKLLPLGQLFFCLLSLLFSPSCQLFFGKCVFFFHCFSGKACIFFGIAFMIGWALTETEALL